jgi:hypothetical protein
VKVFGGLYLTPDGQIVPPPPQHLLGEHWAVARDRPLSQPHRLLYSAAHAS